jgi:hypothetical protein
VASNRPDSFAGGERVAHRLPADKRAWSFSISLVTLAHVLQRRQMIAATGNRFS